MEFFPAPLEKLVEQFARLPGIGGKSAQRLAFHVLNLPMDEAQAFADDIVDAKRSVTLCPVCRNLTAGGLCPICADPRRDETIICVVADPRDVLAIERSREFNGRYHVLHGVLSPMNHVGPDDLQIKSLLDRVAQGNIAEVIMATNPDTEGEATARRLYDTITSLLSDRERLREMGRVMRSLSVENATDEITSLILSLSAK